MTTNCILVLFLFVVVANNITAFTRFQYAPRSIHVIDYSTLDDNDILPSVVHHPVLRQVYPSLLAHQKQYGNPNIPLGSTEGKSCKTLRRLYLQNKLSVEEVNLLEEMKFRLRDLEEIYEEADFDDIVGRLKAYKTEFGNLQVPKKFHEDPELGAWVAMVRRMDTNAILNVEKRDLLNSIGFEWKSARKCGSSFLKNLRELEQTIHTNTNIKDGSNDVEEVVALLNKDQKKWLRAQKLACEKGNLIPARVQYIEDAFPNWRSVS